jgi:single-strand DNA-binding protein
MATTFNKLVGIFRLGKDPEIKYTPAGLAVASFSGASDHSFKKDDKWEKETEWTRMVAFGKSAERIGEQLLKGSLIYVEGRLKTNKWEDKEGVTRYNTDVIVNVINFLDGYTKKEYDGGDSRNAPLPGPPGESDAPLQSAPATDDDIPF